MQKNNILIKKLDKFINEKGAAFVAASLGYRDGKTIKAWIYRESIPYYMIDKVKDLIENNKKIRRKNVKSL